MSDAIDRDAAIRAIEDAEVYTFSDGFPDSGETRREMIAALRALPAVPPAAERLALAYIAWRDTEGQSAGRTIAVFRELEAAESAYRSAKPDSTGAAPPAAEPAIFQKPRGSFDEAAVRGNNPEPAAQPFRHGRCCAEEPKEPAPCGTCGGSGNVGSPCPDGARFIDGVRVSCAVMHSRPCPSCRPGGAA